MYLPTFWKLTTEAYIYKLRHMSGYTVPVTFFLCWVGAPSIYNYYFSCISPPPRGVAKRP